VARALGLSEADNARLLEFLRPREVLLVLDNTEHLLATTSPLAAEALEVAPRLKLLVTSREPLRVRDEQLVQVHPLALPEPSQVPDLAHLAAIPSVALFVERAREANHAFALTSDNAATIAELCQRLDGLPLALELAAARLALLTPMALLARLERRLPLLTRGARDLPQRQQTLRTTIAWSYDLLEAGEQQLFRHLAVFVGGFTLEAIQAVCFPHATGASSAQGDEEGLEQLAQLLDKSLVQVQQGTTSGEPRFSMLETIREYASEQLAASGVEAAVRERHTQYFLQLAEEAELHLYRPAGRDNWLERLEPEDANLRVALAWCEAQQDRAETGLRMAGALTWYWYLRGSLQEGRTWLEALLAHSDSLDRSVVRGLALAGAGMLARFEGDFAAAAPQEEEAVSIAREVGDKHLLAYAGWILGTIRVYQGNIEAARSLLEESHSLFKELEDADGEAHTLLSLGIIAHRSGDGATARTQLEESLRLFQTQGDVLHASMVLSLLQGLLSTQGDQELAHSLYQQSLSLMQQAHDRGTLGLFLINTGDDLHHFGEEHMAQANYREGLRLWQEMRQVEQRLGIVKGLAGLAEIAAAQRQAERAGRLFGAAARLLPATSIYREEVNRRVTAARAHLDAAIFEAGWAAGQTMTEEQAITEALQDA
jgi:predicted ATPase